ncbi:RsmE family RNA methyltransferase [Thermosynechococcaceae cyanobacterium Okahandja]
MRSPQRLVVDPSQIRDRQVHLTPEQVHYLYHVLRLKPRDCLWILDGHGQRWRGQLGGDRTTVDLHEASSHPSELSTEIILCLALLKAANFEQVLQQATELGVRQIVPIHTARSLLQPSTSKYQRWRRIVQEAAEQSERLYLPTIGDPLTVPEMVKRMPHGYVGSPRSKVLLAAYLPTIPWNAPLAVAIGPEGGWTPAELEFIVGAGWQEFSLGRRTLRAVTAATATLSLISHYSEQHLP